MAITSESQLIDIATINNGCQIINDAAQDYITCAKYVKQAAETCNANALEVEKKTMQPTLEELATAIETIQANIESFTTQLKSAATEIYSRQQSELQAYREASKGN